MVLKGVIDCPDLPLNVSRSALQNDGFVNKVADYISFVHEGELLFTKTYEDIQDNYGILRCGKQMFEILNKEDVIAYKKEEFEYRVLIHNRQDFMKVHTDAIVEKADVEDLMLFYIRGERVL